MEMMKDRLAGFARQIDLTHTTGTDDVRSSPRSQSTDTHSGHYLCNRCTILPQACLRPDLDRYESPKALVVRPENSSNLSTYLTQLESPDSIDCSKDLIL
jgi:hypothetical protein